MDKAELHEARTNPEFLNYLEQTRLDAIKTENISALYEVLDSMLILDLDEEKINAIYETILKIAFEKIEAIVNSGKNSNFKMMNYFIFVLFTNMPLKNGVTMILTEPKSFYFCLFILLRIQNSLMLLKST